MRLFATTIISLLSLLFFEKDEKELISERPNVVIIFLDDSGWADFTPFRQSGLRTPNVEQLAKEGCKYTNFYVPQAICSASRAALLTGSYPGRTKVFGAHAPKERGLDTIFPTMGEIFSQAGYKTALFGKWHLGDHEDTRPHNRGFQETSGLLYSNDMWKDHPEDPEFWGRYPLQYWENGEVTISEVTTDDQKNLTKWYTKDAVSFIERNKDNPFLLYVPHSMPHVPIFSSDDFNGKSGKGLYGDVLLELDWSVGEINKAIKENGIEESTIIIFTSDNGPWSVYGKHSGNTPFREAKATSFDGGVRSATIIKYPNQIKRGSQSDFTFFSIDILPSICNLLKIPLPKNEIDGIDVWQSIVDETNYENPHSYYAISTNNRLEALISGDGRYKLHLPHRFRTVEEFGNDGSQGIYKQDSLGPALFDLKIDPFETNDVIKKNKNVANTLLNFAKEHERKFYNN